MANMNPFESGRKPLVSTRVSGHAYVPLNHESRAVCESQARACGRSLCLKLEVSLL